MPLTIAERLGYFKDEGLEVTITDFPGGAKALQSLMGGSAEMVSGAYEHTINSQPSRYAELDGGRPRAGGLISIPKPVM